MYDLKIKPKTQLQNHPANCHCSLPEVINSPEAKEHIRLGGTVGRAGPVVTNACPLATGNAVCSA